MAKKKSATTLQTINASTLKDINVDLRVTRNDILEVITEQLKDQLLAEINTHNENVKNFCDEVNVIIKEESLWEEVKKSAEYKKLSKALKDIADITGRDVREFEAQSYFQREATCSIRCEVSNSRFRCCDAKTNESVHIYNAYLNFNFGRNDNKSDAVVTVSCNKKILASKTITANELSSLINRAKALYVKAEELFHKYQSISSSAKKAKLEMTKQVLQASPEGQKLLGFIASKSMLAALPATNSKE